MMVLVEIMLQILKSRKSLSLEFLFYSRVEHPQMKRDNMIYNAGHIVV